MSDTVTSPNVDVHSGVVRTAKQLSDSLTGDLTDDQIKRFIDISLPIKEKWEERFRSWYGHAVVSAGSEERKIEQAMELIDQMEDELKTVLMEKMNLVIAIDVGPLLEGEPMEIEIVGLLDIDDINKYGMDHEKKTWEVQHATDKDESYYGEKGKHRKKTDAGSKSSRPSTQPASA